MTDPATLTTGAIIALAFQKFIEFGAGELAKKFTEAALSKMDELRQKIRAKLRGNSKAEKALTEVEQGSKAELDRLTVYLQDVIEDEPGFAAELQAISQEIYAGKLQDNSSLTQNIYDQAKGWQTKVEGGTAYIGEIHQYGHDKTTNS